MLEARLSGYGKIQSAFWTDEKIRSYPEDARWLSVYLVTSPHRNLLGCYRLPISYICDDMQWTPDRVTAALTALATGDRPFVARDQNGWTLVVNFLQYHPFASPNHQRAADYLLSQVPKKSPLFQMAAEKLSGAWNTKWGNKPKYLEAASNDLLTPLIAASNVVRTPEPEPEPFPEKIHNKNYDAGASSLKAKLFGPCLTWLAEVNGKDPKPYRSVVGQWIRDHGEIKTLEAFDAAQKETPKGDRIAYVAAILTGPDKRKSALATAMAELGIKQ